MKRIVFVMLATLVAGLTISFAQTSAQTAGGTLRIGVMQCPDGYEGVEYYADCTVPAAGIEFFVSTPYTDNVATGVSSDFEPITINLSQFDLNPGGTGTLWIGERANYDGTYHATCAGSQTPMPVSYLTIDSSAGALYGIETEFISGDEVICNWYRIAAGAAPEDPGDDDGGVSELPNTGAGLLALGRWW